MARHFSTSARTMSSVRLIRQFGLLLPGLALLALVSGLAGFRLNEALGLAAA